MYLDFMTGNGSTPDSITDAQKALRAKQDIESILGSFHETLKWIQGNAIDLEHQTKELEQKLLEQESPHQEGSVL